MSSAIPYFNLDDITLPPEPAADEYDPSQPLSAQDESCGSKLKPIDLDQRATKICLQFKPHVMSTRKILRAAKLRSIVTKSDKVGKHIPDEFSSGDEQSNIEKSEEDGNISTNTVSNKINGTLNMSNHCQSDKNDVESVTTTEPSVRITREVSAELNEEQTRKAESNGKSRDSVDDQMKLKSIDNKHDSKRDTKSRRGSR